MASTRWRSIKRGDLRVATDVSPREAIADDELFDNPETREEANEPTAAGTRGVLPWFPAGVLIPCIVV